MCTIFEARDLNEVFEIVKVAHEAVFKEGITRVVTSIRIDDRRDKEYSMNEKVSKLKNLLK